MSLFPRHHFVILLFCVLINIIGVSAFAQDDVVKPLGEILNSTPIYKNDGSALTASDLANRYYNACVHKDSLVFDQENKEILCGCTAAKMTETMTLQEMQDMDKDNRSGLDARGKMLAYAYAPCMEYVVKPITRVDCSASKRLEGIVVGRKHICNCATERFNTFMINEAPSLIVRYMDTHPMELEPLEDYFSQPYYKNELEHTIKRCRYEFEYDRDH